MDTIKRKPMYRFLIALTIASAAGLQVWSNLFTNFAVDAVGLNGFQIGAIQSVREIPGLLSLCAVFFLWVLKEHHLSSLSVILFGIGVCTTGFFPSFTGLLCTTLFMSFGFHYYETTNQSLTLQYFDEYESPVVMGKQRSITSLTSIIAGIAVLTLSTFCSYKVLYLLTGSAITAMGLWGLRQSPEHAHAIKQHKRMILRKRYGLFYFLTFLSGARRQIFMVFSILLLVEHFHFSIQSVTALLLLTNAANYFAAPAIARAISRFGERLILTIEYTMIIGIFIAYTTCTVPWIIAGLYVLDSVAFNAAMAIRTYFQKVADKQDIAASTAVSFTINHIAAVVLPVAGGFLWTIDFRIPFAVGIFLGAVSLAASQFVRVPAAPAPGAQKYR